MRLLLVEDDEAIAKGVQEALTRAGFTVDRAQDGETAWVMGGDEDYDVAVLDLGLPRLDGMTVLRRWRGEGRIFPIIILSARGAWLDKVEGIEAGADDYLAKPFEPAELVARVGAQGPELLVEVAADRKPILQARAAFGRETAFFLAALWLALAFAAWVQVRMGLRPLDQVRNELDGMSRGADARLALANHPVEIRPLTEAINAVADRRARDIDRARQRARDLAHALKTPITSLRLQIETLPSEKAKEMMHGLSLISAAVESELARTGASSEGETVDARATIERLFAVIARTPDGARVSLHNQVPDGFDVPLGAEAALEAFGAVMENAARHAVSEVQALSGSGPRAYWIEICDDGPGIPDELHAAMLERGGRLDETGRNHGLGLAIARDIVTASGGDLSLAATRKGGLLVRFEWPKTPTS